MFNLSTDGQPGAMVRGFSVTCLLSAILLRVLRGGAGLLGGLVFDLTVAGSIFLLSPAKSDIRRINVGLAFAAAASYVLILCLYLCGHLSSNVFRISLPLIATLPVTVVVCRRMLSLLTDRRFLASQVSGWAAVLYGVRLSIIILYLSLAYLSVNLAEADHATTYMTVIGVLLLSAMYIFLMLRSISLSNLSFSGLRGKMPEINALEESMKEATHAQRELYDRMCSYMDEHKPYLLDSFKLEDLSRSLFTNKGYMSRVINICTGLNFSQMINNYRVRHAVDAFRMNPELKVCEMASLAGFHNTVSFNMAFKLFMASTPGEWCRSYREALEGNPFPSTPQVPAQ